MSANDPNVRIDIIPEELWQKILEAADNPLPKSEASDKGKFLHLNESTGAPEWAEGGSGGGVLVVHDVDDTLDKTWQEIHDSDFAVLKRVDGTVFVTTGSYADGGEYGVGFFTYGADPLTYIATSASGYPALPK